MNAARKIDEPIPFTLGPRAGRLAIVPTRLAPAFVVVDPPTVLRAGTPASVTDDADAALARTIARALETAATLIEGGPDVDPPLPPATPATLRAHVRAINRTFRGGLHKRDTPTRLRIVRDLEHVSEAIVHRWSRKYSPRQLVEGMVDRWIADLVTTDVDAKPVDRARAIELAKNATWAHLPVNQPKETFEALADDLQIEIPTSKLSRWATVNALCTLWGVGATTGADLEREMRKARKK